MRYLRRSHRQVLSGAASLMFVLAAGRGVAQPAGARQTTPKPTATLRGCVTGVEDGLPLRNASVRLLSSVHRGDQNTDDSGCFTFDNIPDGRYTVVASQIAYVTASYPEPRDGVQSQLDVTARTRPYVVNLQLRRGGVITGRVTDPFGTPIPGVTVKPLAVLTVAGRRTLRPGEPARTDDTGQFRLFALTDGEYIVSATLRCATCGKEAYATVYVPGVVQMETASTFVIDSRHPLQYADVSLPRVTTVQVSGTVHDSQGAPMTAGEVIVVSGNSGDMPLGSGQVKPDGTFVIRGLAPGNYRLETRPTMRRGASPFFKASADIYVDGGADVTGIVLEPPAAVKTR